MIQWGTGISPSTDEERMCSMQACLILLTLAVSPSTTQAVVKLRDLVFSAGSTVDQKLDALSVWLNQWKDLSLSDLELLVGNAILTADWEELVKTVQVIQNATSQLLLQCNSSQLLIDLKVLKSRQAVAGAIQGAQVFMFLAYLVTIAVCYLVKRCRKHQKEIAKADFELLETKLQASRSRRRAAAAARTNKQTPQ